MFESTVRDRVTAASAPLIPALPPLLFPSPPRSPKPVKRASEHVGLKSTDDVWQTKIKTCTALFPVEPRGIQGRRHWVASIVPNGRRETSSRLNYIPLLHLWVCFLYFPPFQPTSVSVALSSSSRLLHPPSRSDASADCVRTWCQTATQPSPAGRETPTLRGGGRGGWFLELFPSLMYFGTPFPLPFCVVTAAVGFIRWLFSQL